ncbi:MAG: hypothetical protein ACM3IL_01850, partial [Deltaproteobacteria bacterium]
MDAIAARGYKIDPAVVRKFLQNRNWLVSRQAYSLVNRLEDEQLRIEFIKKYGSTRAEFEKLLILSALKNNFSDSVFQFLAKEMTSSQNQKIRHVIFDMLGSAKDKQKVLEWSNMHF